MRKSRGSPGSRPSPPQICLELAYGRDGACGLPEYVRTDGRSPRTFRRDSCFPPSTWRRARAGACARSPTTARRRCSRSAASSLAERALASLRARRVSEVVVAVTGHRAGGARRRSASWSPSERFNPRFAEHGNVYSLWCARDVVRGGCYIVNSDVLFEDEIARRLVARAGIGGAVRLRPRRRRGVDEGGCATTGGSRGSPRTRPSGSQSRVHRPGADRSRRRPAAGRDPGRVRRARAARRLLRGCDRGAGARSAGADRAAWTGWPGSRSTTTTTSRAHATRCWRGSRERRPGRPRRPRPKASRSGGATWSCRATCARCTGTRSWRGRSRRSRGARLRAVCVVSGADRHARARRRARDGARGRVAASRVRVDDNTPGRGRRARRRRGAASGGRRGRGRRRQDDRRRQVRCELADLPVIVVPTQLTADGIASPVSVIRARSGAFESRHARLPIARRGRPRRGRARARRARAGRARRPARQPLRAARLAARGGGRARGGRRLRRAAGAGGHRPRVRRPDVTGLGGGPPDAGVPAPPAARPRAERPGDGDRGLVAPVLGLGAPDQPRARPRCTRAPPSTASRWRSGRSCCTRLQGEDWRALRRVHAAAGMEARRSRASAWRTRSWSRPCAPRPRRGPAATRCWTRSSSSDDVLTIRVDELRLATIAACYSPSTLITSRLRRPAVELAVEDLLPGAEVEPALGDRQHDLVVDEQVLEVRVAVVLAAAVVAVVAGVGQQLARHLVGGLAASSAAPACRATRARPPGCRARRRSPRRPR